MRNNNNDDQSRLFRFTGTQLCPFLAFLHSIQTCLQFHCTYVLHRTVSKGKNLDYETRTGINFNRQLPVRPRTCKLGKPCYTYGTVHWSITVATVVATVRQLSLSLSDHVTVCHDVTIIITRQRKCNAPPSNVIILLTITFTFHCVITWAITIVLYKRFYF